MIPETSCFPATAKTTIRGIVDNVTPARMAVRPVSLDVKRNPLVCAGVAACVD